ncbi:hypothetical protein [Frondihabitans australicus]|uniref:Uncharacterized protein n=1 Tax=Frondihabitans australicus TaxID=386892 RepID=A0A495IFD9_9MICO|nr:hypothetical protein [Frondihabitans australicus]RKR73766.1 hypothetical protein C8E83_0862 [Frondihabitans australicus]
MSHAADPRQSRPFDERGLHGLELVGSWIVRAWRRVWPTTWIWFGRALIAAMLVTIGLCRATGTTFDSLDAHGGDGTPLSQSAMGISLVLGILSWYVVLPTAWLSMTRREGDLMVGRTVLGRRAVDLSTARVLRFAIEGRGGKSHFVALFGRPHGFLLVTTNTMGDNDYAIETDLLGVARVPGWRAAARRIAVSFACLIAFLAFSALVILVCWLAALGG